MKRSLVFFLSRWAVIVVLPLWLATAATAQATTPTPAVSRTPAPSREAPARPTPSPTPAKIDPKNLTADQVIESAILFYGFPGGRALLERIRKTSFERGTISIVNAEGRPELANYQRFTIRGESVDKDKIRLDQEFPNARYSLVFSESRTFGIFNNAVFEPREDAARAFQAQIYHGLDAMLRYKENGSQVTLAAREKLQGVDYYVLEITDKDNRKTRFFVSARTFRVMMLTYEVDGIKYRRKFYDYNYAQGTLVPYRSVLWANEKQIEETEVGTVTFGQKVDENLFAAG